MNEDGKDTVDVVARIENADGVIREEVFSDVLYSTSPDIHKDILLDLHMSETIVQLKVGDNEIYNIEDGFSGV